MKRSLLVLFAAACVVGCGESPAPAAPESTPAVEETTPEAAPAPDAEALDVGVFVTMAEDALKLGDRDFMKVFRNPEPLASTVNQPGEDAELTSWRFTMEGESPYSLQVTLANFASVEQATGVFAQVPTFSYLRSNLATPFQHRTSRFGAQCVHLAADCAVSPEAFQQVWQELINALGTPTLESTHDQPCAESAA